MDEENMHWVVTVGGQRSDLSKDTISFLPPTIDAFDPPIGEPVGHDGDTTLRILGENFGPAAAWSIETGPAGSIRLDGFPLEVCHFLIDPVPF